MGREAAQVGLRGGWKRRGPKARSVIENSGVAHCIADLDPPAETSRSRSYTAPLASLDIMDYSLTLTVGRRLPGGVIHGLPSLLCSTSFAPSISLTHTLSCMLAWTRRTACLWCPSSTSSDSTRGTRRRRHAIGQAQRHASRGGTKR